MALRPNTGRCPPEADGTDEGKTLRVHVRLRGGYTTVGREPHGWPATGRGGCDWRITGSAFDIVEWELVG